MLDGAVKLLEALKKLLAYRAARRTKVFEQVVKPIYGCVAEVHQDYLSILGQLKHEIESGTPLAALPGPFAIERIGKEAHRRAISSQASSLAKLRKLAMYRPFLNSVVKYFDPDHFVPPNSHMYLILDKLLGLQYIDDPESRFELLLDIKCILKSLRANWEQISSEFATTLATSLR